MNDEEARQELNITPRFPEVIDSTILSTFRACPYKCYLTYFEHWKPLYNSVHLVAGGAFAAGIEYARKAYYQDNTSVETAEAIGLQALIEHYGDFECPADSAKSLERMCGALEFYLVQYPLGDDGAEPITLKSGRRGIEFSFAEVLTEQHPETNEPLIFAGRADMIAEFAGTIFNFDEKTTTQLGQKWSSQWDLRSQFTAYCWAGRRIGLEMQGTIVRGISILKTRYDTQQALTYRAGWELDRWEEHLYHDLARLKLYWEKQQYGQDLDGSCSRSGNPWDRNTDAACNDYGGCQYRQVCKAKNPYRVLENDFSRRVWSPLEHREIPIEEYEAGL